ncbi:MAG: RluA family pseudouridine synthase [Wolinella sp.]
MEKAYKLLSQQLKISNNEAKALIDRGAVSVNGAKINIARTLFAPNTKFVVSEIPMARVIFKDENLLALDKPAFINSEELLKEYKSSGWTLLHRLDRETSGVILLVQDGSEFHKKAKAEFKAQHVYKEYSAIVEGLVSEEMEITKPILVIKGRTAKARISKDGESAHTRIEPIAHEGKRTQLKVVIKTGKTHQIRVHLASINHPIIGDTLYGGRESKRVMLHAHKISILGYEITSPLPKEFFFS